MSGRLLFWDFLSDSCSYLLCPPDDTCDFPYLTKAGVPVKAPPELPPLPQEEGRKEPQEEQEKLKKVTFDKSLDTPLAPRDLDHSEARTAIEDSPFLFLYLSSEDSSQDAQVHAASALNSDDAIPEATDPDPDQRRKQATTHILQTPEDVLNSKGKTREQWIASINKEISNLTEPKAITTVTPEQKEELKAEARRTGQSYVELPAKAVFTIKPEKFKTRICACGNQTQETYGRTSTTDLDAGMLRYLLSWSASDPSSAVTSLDVTAAFLNAALPPGRIVILRPPTILYKLGVLAPGTVWQVHRAIYGLREAPSLWTNERTTMLQKVAFTCSGDRYRLLLSEVHHSICLLVKEHDILKEPVTSSAGLTQRVDPAHVVALCGIYVDDFLTVGDARVVGAFLAYIQKLWKTSEPLYLTPESPLEFLGITIEKLGQGLLLHQMNYTDELMKEYAGSIAQRERFTTGEPEHFEQEAPHPPDMNNPEEAAWVHRAQKILGAFLWLSTRTRPDLACAVSLAAQTVFRDLKLLKVRLRHLLQYLRTTGAKGLLYQFPQGRSVRSGLTEFTTYCDASFAPSGRESQVGYCIMMSYSNVRHLVHWQSAKESKIAESSAEAELYALSTAHKTSRNYRLLIHETLTDGVILNLRSDNTAAITMLDNPSWRTRCISIYGEVIRQEAAEKRVVVTYVNTDYQLADILTKPTSKPVNSRILPLLGLAPPDED